VRAYDHRIDWESRLWELTCRVAEQIASNPAGVLPEEDAKRTVAFSTWVVNGFIDATKPQSKQWTPEEIDEFFRKFRTEAPK